MRNDFLIASFILFYFFSPLPFSHIGKIYASVCEVEKRRFLPILVHYGYYYVQNTFSYTPVDEFRALFRIDTMMTTCFELSGT
jgi:hypothetical protein